MRLYTKNGNYTLYHGSMLDMGECITSNSIDSIVTDPPYELNFMGKGWDRAGVSFQKETWEKCFETLKPGGYLLAFGGSRTYHRIACAIEDAGFEIRDCVMWLYGSGFPKSMNVGLAIDKKNGVESKVVGTSDKGKSTNSGSGIYACNNGKDNSMKRVFDVKEAQNEWKGWGTCLKPAYEPIIVARKPFVGSLVDNVLEHGVGGMNIDECRVPTTDDLYRPPCENGSIYSLKERKYTTKVGSGSYKLGRFPANVIHDGSEEVIANMPDTKGNGNTRHNKNDPTNTNCFGKYNSCVTAGYEDSGSAARYFYCAKASKRDRDEGLDQFEEKSGGSLKFREDGSSDGKISKRRNTHPTVKPTALMQYLIRLVTPRGGVILDPFMGSGSTGKAAMYENKDRDSQYKFIGVDITPEYLPIAEARIKFGLNYND